MEPISPMVKKLRLFFVASVGFVLLAFANMDAIFKAIGTESGTALIFFLYVIGLVYGWFALLITAQKDLHLGGGLQMLTYLGYLIGFTALWIWSSWQPFAAKIFNWVVGIILIIIIVVDIVRRQR